MHGEKEPYFQTEYTFQNQTKEAPTDKMSRLFIN